MIMDVSYLNGQQTDNKRIANGQQILLFETQILEEKE